jgi:hypothetical protein
MPGSSQCGRPAIVEVNGHPICVDCNYKIEMSQWMRFAQNASRYNAALDNGDAITGVSGGFGRMQIPPPPRIGQSGPMVFNNIRVENSTVGVIYSGDVKSIDSVVTTAKTAGHEITRYNIERTINGAASLVTLWPLLHDHLRPLLGALATGLVDIRSAAIAFVEERLKRKTIARDVGSDGSYLAACGGI